MTINIPDDLASFVQQAVASGKFGSQDQVVGEALRLLQQQQESTQQASKKRVGGQLKGQIIIADDFDELPDDIAEAFGMNEA